jgi:hypothetical protein
MLDPVVDLALRGLAFAFVGLPGLFWVGDVATRAAVGRILTRLRLRRGT